MRRVRVLALLDRTPHARDKVVARGLAIPDQAVVGASGRGEADGHKRVGHGFAMEESHPVSALLRREGM